MFSFMPSLLSEDLPKQEVSKYIILDANKTLSLTNEELVSKTSHIHLDMLLICIIDFLLQLK